MVGCLSFARLPCEVGVSLFLARGTARGFAATAGFGVSEDVSPARVSVGGAVATVPVDDGGAESAMWVSAPSRGGDPECGGNESEGTAMKGIVCL